MWKNVEDIEKEDLNCIINGTTAEIQQYIASRLNKSNDYQTKLKTNIIVDCFVNIFVFGKQNSISNEELLDLLHVQEYLLNKCEERLSCDKALEWFIQTVCSSPASERSHTAVYFKNTKNVIDYFLHSFFQHYQLYCYVLGDESEVTITCKKVEVNVQPLITPFPAPLDESFQLSLHEKCIALNKQHSEENIKTHSSLTNNQEKEETATDFLLTSINADQLKQLIIEATDKKLQMTKAELEEKIYEKETALLKSINKLQLN